MDKYSDKILRSTLRSDSKMKYSGSGKAESKNFKKNRKKLQRRGTKNKDSEDSEGSSKLLKSTSQSDFGADWLQIGLRACDTNIC